MFRVRHLSSDIETPLRIRWHCSIIPQKIHIPIGALPLSPEPLSAVRPKVLTRGWWWWSFSPEAKALVSSVVQPPPRDVGDTAVTEQGKSRVCTYGIIGACQSSARLFTKGTTPLVIHVHVVTEMRPLLLSLPIDAVCLRWVWCIRKEWSKHWQRVGTGGIPTLHLPVFVFSNFRVVVWFSNSS